MRTLGKMCMGVFVLCLPRLTLYITAGAFVAFQHLPSQIFKVAVPKARLLWMIWTESPVIRDPG